MKSNYKRLGSYINIIDIRNSSLEVTRLLGVSVKKIFIPSVANTVGTDFKKYKIVRKKQFVYIPDTSRRGDKIGIAMLEDYEKALVSQAYTVFEIIDTDKLNPEYLMMWFRRPEFDRYARYKSHGSVREIFDWEEMCEVELPIPSIEKQNEIVAEYNTVVNCIKLNEQLNKKLEETAQAIYKHWFVDFEFPNEQGKPYKSSGGKMIYNEVLEKDIPVGWEVSNLNEVIELLDNKRIPLSSDERKLRFGIYPYYGAASLMDYVDDYLFEGEHILMGEDGTVIKEDRSPALQYVWGKFWVNNHAHVIKAKEPFSEYTLYNLLKCIDISGIITGGVQAKISQGNLKSLRILYPPEKLVILLNQLLKFNNNSYKGIYTEIKYLVKLKEILLSKMSKL